MTASAPMCHGIRIPLPWYPYPYTHGTPCLLPTYIHALIHLFYLFIYLIVFVSLTLLFSLVLSPLALSLPLARPALGKACPWAGAAGLISLVRANVLVYLIIIQQYTCMVWYVCIYMYCIVYVYTSSIMYVSNRCMSAHDVVCIVLCACGPVYV